MKDFFGELLAVEPEILVMLYGIGDDVSVLIILVDFEVGIDRDVRVSFKCCPSMREWVGLTLDLVRVSMAMA